MNQISGIQVFPESDDVMTEEKECYALCPACGLVIRNDARSKDVFCIRCGSQMMTECPHCTQPIRFAFAIYCDACGKKYIEKNTAVKT